MRTPLHSKTTVPTGNGPLESPGCGLTSGQFPNSSDHMHTSCKAVFEGLPNVFAVPMQAAMLLYMSPAFREQHMHQSICHQALTVSLHTAVRIVLHSAAQIYLLTRTASPVIYELDPLQCLSGKSHRCRPGQFCSVVDSPVAACHYLP